MERHVDNIEGDINISLSVGKLFDLGKILSPFFCVLRSRSLTYVSLIQKNLSGSFSLIVDVLR